MILIIVIVVLVIVAYIGKLLASGSAKEAGEQMQADAGTGLARIAGATMKLGDIVSGGCCCYFVIVFAAMALWPLIGPWSVPLVILAIVVMYIVGKRSDTSSR